MDRKTIIFILFLIKYIITEVPNYVPIKRGESITFNLKEKTSSLYAFLDFEQDYEEGDDNEFSFYYFLKINKKIGVKCKIAEQIPDESEFNKTSEEERGYPLPNIDIEEENMQLVGYEKFKKGMEKNFIVFVFFLKEDYFNVYDEKENFIIERMNNSFFINEGTFEINLNPGEIQILKKVIDDNNIMYNQIFFINSPFSKFYMNFTTTTTNTLSFLGSSLFLYNFFLDMGEDLDYEYPENCPELYFIIYNPHNYTRIVNIEYTMKSYSGFSGNIGDYQMVNLTSNNEDSWWSQEYSVLAQIFSNENGLFYVSGGKGDLKRYFTGNIEEIKNLTDLKNVRHYKYYLTEGPFYTNKKYFFLLVNSLNEEICMTVTKINIEEKGKEINELNFTYFKISEGNTLSFTSNSNNNFYIIKLVSDNNGTVIINNNEYYFEEQTIKVIEINDTFTTLLKIIILYLLLN